MEVVLAVGVIAFAFVAIMGLLPAGLTQYRQAMDNSVCAQIAQRIILECQQSDFTTLTTPPTQPPDGGPQVPPYFQPVVLNGNSQAPHTVRYFDEQGNEVIIQGTTPSQTELMGSMGGTGSAKATLGILYFVNTRISSSTTLPGSNGGVANAGLATITIQIAFNPGGNALKWLTTAPTTLLIDTTQTKLPTQAVKTYCAQIGRNG